MASLLELKNQPGRQQCNQKMAALGCWSVELLQWPWLTGQARYHCAVLLTPDKTQRKSCRVVLCYTT